MILVYHLVRSAMCLSMDFSASSKTVLPCTSNFKDCSRPSSFLHSKPASMKMCEIFPPDMDWLLCKYEAEDATCQTELLIDGFSSQGHIRESTSLCAHLRLSLGFRFACSTLHACSACMDRYENFQDNDIGLLSGHCSAESVDWVFPGLQAAGEFAAGHEPGPWDPVHAPCSQRGPPQTSDELRCWDPNWSAGSFHVLASTSPSLPSPLKPGNECSQGHSEHQGPADLHAPRMPESSPLGSMHGRMPRMQDRKKSKSCTHRGQYICTGNICMNLKHARLVENFFSCISRIVSHCRVCSASSVLLRVTRMAASVASKFSSLWRY